MYIEKSCISEKLIIHMMFHAKLYFNVWNINYYQLSILKKFYVLLKKNSQGSMIKRLIIERMYFGEIVNIINVFLNGTLYSNV